MCVTKIHNTQNDQITYFKTRVPGYVNYNDLIYIQMFLQNISRSVPWAILMISFQDINGQIPFSVLLKYYIFYHLFAKSYLIGNITASIEMKILFIL